MLMNRENANLPLAGNFLVYRGVVQPKTQKQPALLAEVIVKIFLKY